MRVSNIWEIKIAKATTQKQRNLKVVEITLQGETL
jgi:hypothetical protein